MSRFQVRLLLLVLVFLALGSGIVGLVSVARYKPYGVPDLLRDKFEAKQAEIRAAVEENRKAEQLRRQLSQDATLPAPKAVVAETEHDFGMLDPGGSASHTFVIRNEGTATLLLSAGDTSCKCTLSEVGKQVVQPGDFAEITLTWNTGSTSEFYRQYALVKTNDPFNKEIELAVTGQVRALLTFDSEQVTVPNVSPGEAVEASTILYSQFLSSIDVEEVSCELPGFKHTLEPLADDELQSLGAKAGWRIRFSSDASLGQGLFNHLLRARVTSPQLSDEESPLFREVAISGSVAAPISFYGADLHSQTGLDMGVVSDGKEHVAKLLVRVRGAYVPDRMIVSRVEPRILDATIEPVESRPGVYNLTLRIPAGAPQTIFNREQQHGLVEVCDAANPDFKNWVPIYGAVIKI